MAEIQVTRERLNGFRLTEQGLFPRSESLSGALAGIGWLPTREAGLLAARVRLSELDPSEYLREVSEGFVEMAAMRDESWLVPRDLAPAYLRPSDAERRRNNRLTADHALVMD